MVTQDRKSKFWKELQLWLFCSEGYQSVIAFLANELDLI